MALFYQGRQEITVELQCDATEGHAVAEALVRLLEIDFPNVGARVAVQVNLEVNSESLVSH